MFPVELCRLTFLLCMVRALARSSVVLLLQCCSLEFLDVRSTRL